MDHKITVTSPFIHSPRSAEYGKDNFYQVALVEKAIQELLQDPFEKGLDLRGRTFLVHMHQDGLSVTAELIPKPISRSSLRYWRPVDEVDLLGQWESEGGA